MEPGDVVKLKSGGPPMTIAWIDGKQAWCDWIDEGKPQGHKFYLSVLEKVEDTDT